VRIEACGRATGSKLIRISAEIEGGVITAIKIRGDFFASPPEAFDRAEGRLPGTALSDIAPVFDRLLLEESVEADGINGKALREVIRGHSTA
jgi:hypothetical protein